MLCPPPGDLPNPGIEPRSLTLQADSLQSESPGKPKNTEVGQFSRSVVSDSLRPHGLQHMRLPCPSPTPGAYTNSCPSSWRCHLALIFYCPFLFLPSTFPSVRVFSSESVLCIRWPKYWSFSFSISSSNERSGLISFRMD